MSSRGGLARRDFDKVMRRAAELAAEDPGGAEDAFSDAEVVRIGREVGLPERHVRRALAEHRARGGRGGGVAARWGWSLQLLLCRDEVSAGRTIERPRARIRDELDEFMVGGQLLQQVRRRDDLLQYRPAVDWVSRVARAASFRSRQHYVASSRFVEVHLERLGTGSTRVGIRVDPGIAANYRNWWVMAGCVAGPMAGVAVGVGMAAPSLLAVGAVLTAGGAAVLMSTLVVALLAAPGFRRRLADVQSEVEAVLDGLEKENGLEPPPPAWRRWVRRRFHGVAREMMGTEQGDSNWRSKS